jgi:integrating conjugative element protein (TIGR03759 family)
MQGRALYFATDMPPLMVLAMYAESDKEQNRFAEMLAQYERDKVERIQKVQRAYDAAMNRLYPNEKIIDLDLLRQQGLLAQSPSAVSGLSQNTADNRTPRFGDTLAIFATPDCSVCADKIRRIVTQYSIAPLEVYFAGEPAAFKEWLQQSEMKTDWLKQHSVTFARDEGQSKQYQAAPGTVFIVRDRALLEMML